MAYASGDIDGDGLLEHVAGDAFGNTRVTKGEDPTVIWGAGSAYIGGPGGTWNRHPADVFLAADLDGDGIWEVVIFNNWDYWTGVVKWVPGSGLQTIWKSGSPLAGPAGSWNRRNDEMSIVGYERGVAIAVRTPGNDWHGILKWQSAPAPGHLELVEMANADGVIGPRVSKWTYLANTVEVIGTVMPGFGSIMMNLQLDSNFAHLTDAVPGSAGVIHCETYPEGIASNDGKTFQINRYAGWALPDVEAGDALAGKVWDYSSSPPTTRDLQVYDRVHVRGRLIIENGHPIQNGIAQHEGGDGWVFLELHPFDHRNVRLVGAPRPNDVVHETLVIASPLYEYNKWTSPSVSNAWIRLDGALFHNSVSADVRIMAPSAPPLGVDPKDDVFFRETIVQNGTGLPLDSVRQLRRIPGGIEVHATIDAPIVQHFGGIGVGDVDDPAHDRSVLVIEYDVGWRPLSSGAVRHTIRVPSRWHPVGDVNSQIGDPGAVVAVAATSDGVSDVQFFMVTQSGHLWHTVRFADGSWQPVGDVIAQVGYFGPVAAVCATSTAQREARCLMLTGDGHLWHTVRHADGSWMPLARSAVVPRGKWDAFGDVTSQVGVPGRVVALAATSADTADAQFLLATDDGGLWHTLGFARGNWQIAGDVKAVVGDLGRVIAVAATSAVAGDAQFAFVTDDGHVWHTIRSADGSWQPAGDVNRAIGDLVPTTTGPAGSAVASPSIRSAEAHRVVAVAATSAAPGEAEFLFATGDGHLWHTIRRADGSWTRRGDVNGQTGDAGRATAVAAASALPGEAQYFFCVR